MATDITSAAPLGLASDASLATGAFTSAGDGNLVSIVIGNNPRFFKIVNLTDGIVWEKYQGFPANTTLKYTSTGVTVDTTSAITFPADAGLNEPGNAVLLSAALVGSAKLLAWASLG